MNPWFITKWITEKFADYENDIYFEARQLK